MINYSGIYTIHYLNFDRSILMQRTSNNEGSVRTEWSRPEANRHMC